MARPLKEINQKAFENLCGLLCTQEEICSFFDVTDKTLSGWCRRTYGKSFSEIYRIKSVQGKISLRRYQLQLAQKSAAMAIFLGKNWLGQKDAPVEVTHTASPIDQITEQIFKLQKEQAEAQDADTDADS